ncbi:trypsin-like protease, partial [Thamnocephalis sphaerospora]
VLTAAHCMVEADAVVGSTKGFFRAPLSEVQVAVGSILNTTASPIGVKRVVISPLYDPKNNTHDIALLELNSALTFNNSVKPALITSARIGAGKSCVALGWGYTENRTVSNVLQQVQLETAKNDQCSTGYPGWAGQDGDLICTGNTPGRDTCYGDSGGPL